MIFYRVRVTVDYADTSRDPSEIVTNVDKAFLSEQDAIKFAKSYISEKFSHPSRNVPDKLIRSKETILDVCSWGEVLTIERVTD